MEMANWPKPIEKDRRARLERTLAEAHAQLRTAKARGADGGLQSRILSDIARIEGILSRMDDRAPRQADNASAGNATPDRRQYILAIKEALGYRAPSGWTELDLKLLRDLRAACERRPTDSRFAASALRLISILKGVELPDEVERQIEEMEAHTDDSFGPCE